MKDIITRLKALIISEPKPIEPLSQEDLGSIKKCLDKEPARSTVIGKPSRTVQARPFKKV